MSGFIEFQEAFEDLRTWKAWLESNAWSMQPSYAHSVADFVSKNGLVDPIHGFAPPDAVTMGHPYQESILVRGLNSRQRALTKAIAQEGMPRDSIVYASESITPLAAALRRVFPRFVGSEYLPSITEREKFPDIRHEDVQALSFASGSLDAYVSSGVLEHIPSVSMAISEAGRVLRPGGVFFAYFPFRLVDEDTLIKATMDAAGRITLLTEPEYHGDPVDAAGKGVLVYSIPGWDILKMARSAGFRRAEMVAITSRVHGIVNEDAPAPVLVMRAVK